MMQRVNFTTAQDNSMPIWSHDGTRSPGSGGTANGVRKGLRWDRPGGVDCRIRTDDADELVARWRQPVHNNDPRPVAIFDAGLWRSSAAFKRR
jgi:hypothetical protein